MQKNAMQKNAMQIDQQAMPTTGDPGLSRPAQPTRRRPGPPVFPEHRLTVRPWNDPVLDHLGHDPRSPYVETFWLAVLGPSCLFLLRRLAARLEREPDGIEVDAYHLALELGLGMKGGKHGPFWRAIERACRFKAAQRNGDVLVVRRRIAPLTARQVARLPPHLQSAHRAFTDERQQQPRRKTVTNWSDRRDTSPDLDPPPDPEVASDAA